MDIASQIAPCRRECCGWLIVLLGYAGISVFGFLTEQLLAVQLTYMSLLAIVRLFIGWRFLSEIDREIEQTTRDLIKGLLPLETDNVKRIVVREDDGLLLKGTVLVNSSKQRTGAADVDGYTHAIMAELNRRVASLSMMASVMPMLGMLGTVIGFAVMLSAIGSAAGDPEAFDGAMSEAMKGMGVSLLTTLVGCFWAVAFLFLTHVAETAVESLATKIRAILGSLRYDSLEE